MAPSTCTTTTTCAVAAGASPSAATNVFAAVDVAFVGVMWVGPVVIDVSVGACCGFDKVDEAVEDADFAFEFGAVDEGLVRDLDEVEACELESDNSDFDWVGSMFVSPVLKPYCNRKPCCSAPNERELFSQGNYGTSLFICVDCEVFNRYLRETKTRLVNMRWIIIARNFFCT